jgi:hypothetical protein
VSIPRHFSCVTTPGLHLLNYTWLLLILAYLCFLQMPHMWMDRQLAASFFMTHHSIFVGLFLCPLIPHNNPVNFMDLFVAFAGLHHASTASIWQQILPHLFNQQCHSMLAFTTLTELSFFDVSHLPSLCSQALLLYHGWKPHTIQLIIQPGIFPFHPLLPHFPLQSPSHTHTALVYYLANFSHRTHLSLWLLVLINILSVLPESLDHDGRPVGRPISSPSGTQHTTNTNTINKPTPRCNTLPTIVNKPSCKIIKRLWRVVILVARCLTVICFFSSS